MFSDNSTYNCRRIKKLSFEITENSFSQNCADTAAREIFHKFAMHVWLPQPLHKPAAQISLRVCLITVNRIYHMQKHFRAIMQD